MLPLSTYEYIHIIRATQCMLLKKFTRVFSPELLYTESRYTGNIMTIDSVLVQYPQQDGIPYLSKKATKTSRLR